jgi:hypothetical protein
VEGRVTVMRRMRGEGTTSAAAGGLAGVLDEFFNPGAARAREELQGEHERVQETPSPGDLLLRDGVLVVRRPQPPAEDGPVKDA